MIALFQDRGNSVFPADRHDVDPTHRRTESPHGTGSDVNTDSCDLIPGTKGIFNFWSYTLGNDIFKNKHIKYAPLLRTSVYVDN